MKKLLFLLLVIFLTGCEGLKEGEIVNKWYEPENTRTVLLPVMITSGKMTMTMMVPHRVVDGEDFCIEIKGYIDDKEVTKTFYLTKERWDTLQRGQLFCVDGDCNKNDFTYNKRRL